MGAAAAIMASGPVSRERHRRGPPARHRAGPQPAQPVGLSRAQILPLDDPGAAARCPGRGLGGECLGPARLPGPGRGCQPCRASRGAAPVPGQPGELRQPGGGERPGSGGMPTAEPGGRPARAAVDRDPRSTRKGWPRGALCHSCCSTRPTRPSRPASRLNSAKIRWSCPAS